MNDVATPLVIGRNVRKERHERKLSLDELAAASGVSKATLSQIESGKVNPTVATLWKIAQSIDVDLHALIMGESEKIRIFSVSRHNDLPLLSGAEGVEIRVLSPISFAGDTELYMLNMAPDAALESEAHAPGCMEILSVNAGQFKVTAGKNSTVLEAGDVLAYQCDVPHRIENLSEGKSQLYMTVKFA